MGCDSNSAETQERRKQSNYDFTSFPAIKVLCCFDQHLHQSEGRHFLPIIPLNNNPRRDSVAVCNLPQLTTLALQALSRLSALQPLICTDSKTGKPALIKLAALKKNFKKLKDCANLFLDSI